MSPDDRHLLPFCKLTGDGLGWGFSVLVGELFGFEKIVFWAVISQGYTIHTGQLEVCGRTWHVQLATALFLEASIRKVNFSVKATRKCKCTTRIQQEC